MKVAATFLLSVTVFIALFLESSTTPVDTVDKVLGDVGAVVNGVAGAVAGKLSAALNKIECVLRRTKVNAVQAMVTKAFDISNAALDDAIKAVAEALAKAKGEPLEKGGEKDPSLVLNWLKSLVGLSALAENTIDDALAKDTTEYLQNATALLSQAIEEVKADLPKYVRILEESPSKCVNSAKAVVEKNIDIILAYATYDLKEINSLLPGADKGCNAAA